jgi:tetratricopeptide (TPR) repeat protein
MMRKALRPVNKIVVTLLVVSIFTACNNEDSTSPYDDVVRQKPFMALTDSIRKEPGRDDLYFRRAVLLNKNNFPEPALADFRKAWSIAKNEAYAVSVSKSLMDKNPDSAIVFLQEAIPVLPESILLRINLARSYDALQKTDEAIRACDDILAQEPEQVNALLLKADLLEKKLDTKGVIAVLEKAYAQMPANLEIGNRLAYQYAEAKNPKALVIADSNIARDPQRIFSNPYYVKGLYYSNINEKAKAIQWFDTTIHVDHRYLSAYIEKGKILLEQKKTGEAMKTFALANRITPSFPDAWYWMGRCQEALGDKASAKENYEKAYELDKTFTEAREAAAKLK